MKFNKFNKEGLARLDHFISTGSVDDIHIRQASNSLRIFATGSSYHAGRFNIELSSGEVAGSMLAALGHAINEHEEKATRNV